MSRVKKTTHKKVKKAVVKKTAKKSLAKKNRAKKTVTKKAVKSAPKKNIAKKKVNKKKLVKRKSVNLKKKQAKKILKRRPLKVKSSIKKTKKRVVKMRKLKVLPDEVVISRLLKKAKIKGFVTELEVLNVFPELEEYVFEYEKFLSYLEKLGIAVAEGEVGLLSKKEDRTKMLSDMGVGGDKKRLDLSDISSDSIQMYLREIGKKPLLKSEEEMQLARRKEKGKNHY